MTNKKSNVIKFPASPSKLERQVEAILFAASEPLDIETIEKRIETNTNIKKILINLRYFKENSYSLKDFEIPISKKISKEYFNSLINPFSMQKILCYLTR